MKVFLREAKAALVHPVTVVAWILFLAVEAWGLRTWAPRDYRIIGVFSGTFYLSFFAALTLFLLLRRDERFRTDDLVRNATLSSGALFLLRYLSLLMVYGVLFLILPSAIWLVQDVQVLWPLTLLLFLLAMPGFIFLTVLSAIFSRFIPGLFGIPLIVVFWIFPFMGVVLPPAFAIFFPYKLMKSSAVFGFGFQDPALVADAAGGLILIAILVSVLLFLTGLETHHRYPYILPAGFLLLLSLFYGYALFSRIGRNTGSALNMLSIMGITPFSSAEPQPCLLANSELSLREERGIIFARVTANFKSEKETTCLLALPEQAVEPALTLNGKPLSLKKGENFLTAKVEKGSEGAVTATYRLPPYLLARMSALGVQYSLGYGGAYTRFSLSDVGLQAGTRTGSLLPAEETMVLMMGHSGENLTADGECHSVSDGLSCLLKGQNPMVMSYLPPLEVAREGVANGEAGGVSFSIALIHGGTLPHPEWWKKSVSIASSMLQALEIPQDIQVVEAYTPLLRAVAGTGIVPPETLIQWANSSEEEAVLGFCATVFSTVVGTRSFGAGASSALSDEIALLTAFLTALEAGGIPEEKLREAIRKQDENWAMRMVLQNPELKKKRQNFYELLAEYKQHPEELKRRLKEVYADLRTSSQPRFRMTSASDPYVEYLLGNTEKIEKREESTGGSWKVESGGMRIEWKE